MPKITINDIESNSQAQANQINTRIGTIVDLVNGNLDADNLANGAVTNSKIADGSISSSKLDQDSIYSASGVITLGKTMIEWGSVSISNIGSAAYSETSKNVTFQEGFIETPIVLAVPGDIGNAVGEYCIATNISKTGFTIYAGKTRETSGSVTMENSRWIAIGIKE